MWPDGQWCCDSRSSNLPFQRWIPPTGPSVVRAGPFSTHFIYLTCFLVSPLSHGYLFHFSYLSQHSVNYSVVYILLTVKLTPTHGSQSGTTRMSGLTEITPLVTGFSGPHRLCFFLHISFISCPASWLSLPLLLPAATHLTGVCFTISIHSTHRSNDSAFQLQISGSKSHYNPIRYSIRADRLKQSEGPGPALCMPGSSQSKSIQGKMFQSQLISQKIRSLRYE